jgi:hypothetical protein
VSDGGRLTFENTSLAAVRGSLFAMWGDFPIRLSKARDIRLVESMAAAAKSHGNAHAPFVQILDALNKFGELEIADG